MARIAAKATRGKGKKYPKGQSCQSNPQTKKHRSKVTQMLGNSMGNSNSNKISKPKLQLTRDVLEKFNAVQSLKNQSNMLQKTIESNQNKNISTSK